MTNERWELVKTVFEAVLERHADARDSCIAELCGNDASLRSEIEALLLAHNRAGSFMARPVMADLMDGLEIPGALHPEDIISDRFRILRLIGEGGMGHVYEAEDLELKVRIALKTIRPKIASDRHTLARFRQELHLNRRITHPNVCRAFDIAHGSVSHAGNSDTEITYITMELLEGETLATRLQRGRMTTTEALPLVRQMVEALDAAHSMGVVHRDFKPSNVILCPQFSGNNPSNPRVVITDFGLACSYAATDVSASLTHSGQLIGTLAYMAPEQAQGRDASPATDIYSCGLVIYEMVTGIRPFPDEGPFAGVIERLKEPAPSPKLKVPNLEDDWEYTILRCLEIEPKNRFQQAREINSALSGIGIRSLPGRRRRQLRKSNIFYLAVFAVLLLAVGGIWVWRHGISLKEPSAAVPGQLEVTQFTADGGVTFQPSVSPDGRHVAYSSDRAGNGILDIWLQDIRDGAGQRVTNEPADAIEPDLSPDGTTIAFRSERDGGIYLISTNGHNRRRIAPNGHQPKFSPDGLQILYWNGDWIGDFSNPFFAPTGKIYLVSANRGPAQQIQKQFPDARLPLWLPDGRRILFLGAATLPGSAMNIEDWWIADLSHPQSQPTQTHAFEVIRRQAIIVQDFAPAWWGDSVIFSGRSAQTTNLFRLRLSSQDFQPVSGIERLTVGAAYETTPSVSNQGTVFFTSANPPINVWTVPLTPGTENGKKAAPVQLTFAASTDTRPSISNDGTKLVFARRWGNDRDVWEKDLRTGTETKLTSSAVTTPLISPDGLQVAYSTFNNLGNAAIKVFSFADRTTRQVCADCGDPLDWASDNSALLYSTINDRAVVSLDLRSGEKTILLNREGGLGLASASFCPDRRCVVFSESLDGANSKLWMAPLAGQYPIPRTKWVALTDGDHNDDKPRWSKDGHWLFFYSNRDGSACIWRLAFSPSTFLPRSKPNAFLHLHRAGFSLRELSRTAFDFRVADDKLIFNAVSYSANIWAIDLAKK